MIDWQAIEEDLGLLEQNEPEAILHELVHTYDCIREDAFSYVGVQAQVSELIQTTFPTQRARNRAEVRVSAITHLVMQGLGLPDDRQNIVQSMLSNLEGSGSHAPWKAEFDRYVAGSRPVLAAVRAILTFLKKYDGSNPAPAVEGT